MLIVRSMNKCDLFENNFSFIFIAKLRITGTGEHCYRLFSINYHEWFAKKFSWNLNGSFQLLTHCNYRISFSRINVLITILQWNEAITIGFTSFLFLFRINFQHFYSFSQYSAIHDTDTRQCNCVYLAVCNMILRYTAVIPIFHKFSQTT